MIEQTIIDTKLKLRRVLTASLQRIFGVSANPHLQSSYCMGTAGYPLLVVQRLSPYSTPLRKEEAPLHLNVQRKLLQMVASVTLDLGAR